MVKHRRVIASHSGRRYNAATMKTQFSHAYVLDVMSDDHPGIIAAVSTAGFPRPSNRCVTEPDHP